MNKKRDKSVCEWQGVEPKPPARSSKLGIALSTIGKGPINGVRHEEEGGTNGWYIWCGEGLSDDLEFFSPLHTEHIDEYLPEVKEFLDLPPGYRFLIDGNNYEDVWLDESVLLKRSEPGEFDET